MGKKLDIRRVWVSPNFSASCLGIWGLTHGGSSPKFQRTTGRNSVLENQAFSGLIGALSRPILAFLRLISTNQPWPYNCGEAEAIAPRESFLPDLHLWAKPLLAKPPVRFPRCRATFEAVWQEQSKSKLRTLGEPLIMSNNLLLAGEELGT